MDRGAGRATVGAAAAGWLGQARWIMWEASGMAMKVKSKKNPAAVALGRLECAPSAVAGGIGKCGFVVEFVGGLAGEFLF